MNDKVLALFSGGLDSTVMLAELRAQGARVAAVSINYGQRHVRELVAARAIARHLNVAHDVVSLPGLATVLAGSALTSPEVPVPDGHYAEDSMRATVVPNRNAIMLSIAVGIAASQGFDAVATAVHAGDHYVYPDCRPEFMQAMNVAAQLGTASFGDVRVDAPFVDKTKAQIVELGELVGAPLKMSWSCYKGGKDGGHHCGSCGTCVERREAFELAGVTDPTYYVAEPVFDTPASMETGS